jgi:hypothetical protein
MIKDLATAKRSHHSPPSNSKIRTLSCVTSMVPILFLTLTFTPPFFRLDTAGDSFVSQSEHDTKMQGQLVANLLKVVLERTDAPTVHLPSSSETDKLDNPFSVWDRFLYLPALKYRLYIQKAELCDVCRPPTTWVLCARHMAGTGIRV